MPSITLNVNDREVTYEVWVKTSRDPSHRLWEHNLRSKDDCAASVVDARRHYGPDFQFANVFKIMAEKIAQIGPKEEPRNG